MEAQALVRLEALRRRNAKRDWVNKDLYRLLFKLDLFEIAYEKIKSNPGNMTNGTDGITLDGFSYTTIGNMIQSLRDESFQFKPARREYIPKSNGKLRPLGVASPRDKIVQEIIHLILEAIYDSPHGPYFHDSSHGFRPNRSCHSALKEFRLKWTGVVWIIEGDIKSCFDEIDHEVLVSLLKRKIDDDRFLNLIWKSLRAGYLWKREKHDSLCGSPQGSICSPILANIYLHELDDFIESLRQKYEKGSRRKPNRQYRSLCRKRHRILEQNGKQWTGEVKSLTKQMRALPSVATDDPNYVRIKYLRYADDWIVGIIGPRELAETVKTEIREFLWQSLKLQLSEEKTRITHARTEEAFFLGTRLMIGATGPNVKFAIGRSSKGRRYKRRSTGMNPVLKAPIGKLVKRLHEKGFCKSDGTPISKAAWTYLEVDQVVNLYNSILRGLLNYYRFTHNFGSMIRIEYILRFSLAKTLAHKYRISMRKIFCKHGRNLKFQWNLPNGKTRVVCFAENTDWSINTDAYMDSPPQPDLLAWQMRLRTTSKLGFPCLICGSENQIEMHHVRHIRKMGERPPTGFRAVMRKLNRKQIPVCTTCHQKIHSGEYDSIGLNQLAYDFAARPT